MLKICVFQQLLYYSITIVLIPGFAFIAIPVVFFGNGRESFVWLLSMTFQHIKRILEQEALLFTDRLRKRLFPWIIGALGSCYN